MHPNDLIKEEHYRTIFENIPVGICITTLDGTIIAYNSMLQRITGYTRKDMSTLNVETFYARPGDRKLMLEHIRNKDALRDYMVDLKRKDGRIFHAVISVIKHYYTAEKTILTVIQDITEQKKIKDALVESERRLMDIINFLPDATFAIDTEGRVIA